jgi:hypothetical protein
MSSQNHCICVKVLVLPGLGIGTLHQIRIDDLLHSLQQNLDLKNAYMMSNAPVFMRYTRRLYNSVLEELILQAHARLPEQQYQQLQGPTATSCACMRSRSSLAPPSSSRK